MHPGTDDDAPGPVEAGAGQDREGAEEASRRETLASLGRFAYVAPALMLLAEPGLAHADYGKGSDRGGDKGEGKGK